MRRSTISIDSIQQPTNFSPSADTHTRSTRPPNQLQAIRLRWLAGAPLARPKVTPRKKMEPKEGPPPTSPRGGAAGGGGGGAEGGGGGGGGALRLGAKAAVGTGSATATVVAERVHEPAVLRLVLEPRPHVRWGEGVVDNEHMNKKSSKRELFLFNGGVWLDVPWWVGVWYVGLVWCRRVASHREVIQILNPQISSTSTIHPHHTTK